ncbi:MAG: DEAD/DEAH box helicase, partial [Acidimicrobiia bacterium]
GDAPVVVMTTEVLRNMIYGGSDALDRLSHVVLDEVHFLQDTYRGPVWEEVIIHLPHHVRLVCLSATVSNAEELAEWMETVRGATATIIEDRRPVTLDNLFMIGDRTADRLHLLPTLVDGRPNAEASRIDSEAMRGGARDHWRSRARRRLYTPRRVEVVERLDDEDMLPAIYFIFSRNACTEAANACVAAGLRLTTADERDRIREIVDERLAGLDAADLAVLDYAAFITALESGIASHHAGLVPPFKEAVEACFVEGLVKVVFATETLAVGINMPARSVVIEKLTKFTGERHTFLTPGEYTQLTGRAGRRGIDDIGYAVVLWSPFVPFDQVAALASSRTFELTSAFRPTYNMAANLVRSYPADQAHHLLNLSFAQFQADRDVVRLETRLERRSIVLSELRTKAISPYGDLEEYRGALSRDQRRALASDGPSRKAIDDAVAKLRPGDIIRVDIGKRSGPVAVLSVSQRRGGAAKVRAITTNRVLLGLTGADFDELPDTVGRIDLPVPFAPNKQSYQREVATALMKAKLKPVPRSTHPHAVALDGDDSHPVTEDPDLPGRLKAAAHADRVAREVEELRTKVKGRSESLARRFDRVLRLLGTWGYLDGWHLTEAGERLSRLFHESDLLVAEALERGILDGVDSATLAALASCFTYEHRSPEAPPAPWFPSAKARKRWEAIETIAKALNIDEDDAALPLTRMPDPTFAAVAYAWAAGEGFASVVAEEELSGGDFVRNVKQLIDLLRQIGDIAPVESTRATARDAADRLFRGVVAASTAVG